MSACAKVTLLPKKCVVWVLNLVVRHAQRHPCEPILLKKLCDGSMNGKVDLARYRQKLLVKRHALLCVMPCAQPSPVKPLAVLRMRCAMPCAPLALQQVGQHHAVQVLLAWRVRF
jgi:hypothetical protein